MGLSNIDYSNAPSIYTFVKKTSVYNDLYYFQTQNSRMYRSFCMSEQRYKIRKYHSSQVHSMSVERSSRMASSIAFLQTTDSKWSIISRAYSGKDIVRKCYICILGLSSLSLFSSEYRAYRLYFLSVGIKAR